MIHGFQFSGLSRYGQPGWTYTHIFIFNNKRYPNQNEMQHMEKKYYFNSQGNHFGIPSIKYKIKKS